MVQLPCASSAKDHIPTHGAGPLTILPQLMQAHCTEYQIQGFNVQFALYIHTERLAMLGKATVYPVLFIESLPPPSGHYFWSNCSVATPMTSIHQRGRSGFPRLA